jgi:hypothetical protein
MLSIRTVSYPCQAVADRASDGPPADRPADRLRDRYAAVGLEPEAWSVRQAVDVEG